MRTSSLRRTVYLSRTWKRRAVAASSLRRIVMYPLHSHRTLLRHHLNRPPRVPFAPVSSFLRPMAIPRLSVPHSQLPHISTSTEAQTLVRAPSHLGLSLRVLLPLFPCRSLPKTLTLQPPMLFPFPLPQRYPNSPKAAALTFTHAQTHIPSCQ